MYTSKKVKVGNDPETEPVESARSADSPLSPETEMKMIGEEGGEPESPSKAPQDSVYTFMMQIPPDWEKAEAHGRANLCVDSALTELDLQSPDTFCPCCQLPYPSDEAFYRVCESNDRLGELGEGFPAFFLLMKYLTILMLVLTVVFFAPTAYFMYLAYEKIKDKMTDEDDTIGLFSFGVFVKFSDRADPAKYAIFEDRKTYIEVVSGLMMVSIIVTILGNVCIRKRLLDKAVKLDKLAITPSDFALLGYCREFSSSCDYTKASIEQEIKDHFRDEYAIEDIEYVNICYDIHDVYSTTAQLENSHKNKALLEAFMQDKGWKSHDELKAQDPSSFEDWPKEKTACSSSFLDIDQIEFNIEQHQNRMNELTHEAVLDGEDQQDQIEARKSRYTGVIFVVCKQPHDTYKVIDGQIDSLALRFLRNFCSCLYSKKSATWRFQRAPEPSDVNWENMQVSTCERILRASVSYVMSLLTVGMTFGLIFGIKVAQDEYMTEEFKGIEQKSFQQQGLAKFLSAMVSAVIAIMNVILRIVIRMITTYEKHETMTNLNISVAFKLTIARFLNSSLIILIFNWDKTKQWYNGGNLVYDATLLIVILLFLNPILYLMNIGGIIKMIKKKVEMGKGSESKMTQKEANILCEGPPVDPANNISNYMNLIMTCIFYSPIVPLAIPMALVGSFFNYWTNKYMLLKRHAMPDMFSREMATFFANLVPYMALIWAASFVILIDRQIATHEDIKEDVAGLIDAKEAAKSVIGQNARQFAQVSFIVACICICCPFRYLINRFIDEDEVLQNETKYRDVALTFSSDYDKENPLTSQKGQLRLLDLQIEKAKLGGNSDENQKNIQQLEEQKKMIHLQSGSAADRMKDYVNSVFAKQQQYQKSYNPQQYMQQQLIHNHQQQLMQIQMHRRLANMRNQNMMQFRMQAMMRPDYQRRMTHALQSHLQTGMTQPGQYGAQPGVDAHQQALQEKWRQNQMMQQALAQRMQFQRQGLLVHQQGINHQYQYRMGMYQQQPQMVRPGMVPFGQQPMGQAPMMQPNPMMQSVQQPHAMMHSIQQPAPMMQQQPNPMMHSINQQPNPMMMQQQQQYAQAPQYNYRA